jgi:hypothetical protein
MAIAAFNHSIDRYSTNQDELCKQWPSKALNLAHYCLDGGRLEEILQEKYLTLKSDA